MSKLDWFGQRNEEFNQGLFIDDLDIEEEAFIEIDNKSGQWGYTFATFPQFFSLLMNWGLNDCLS